MNKKNIVFLQIKLDEKEKARLQIIASHFERDMSKQVRHWINQDWQELHPDQTASASGVADVKA